MMGERKNRKMGAGMLSVGEILLLNQLMYCPKEEDGKRTMDAYQGNTIGALLDSWRQKPFLDEAQCGFCMKGREWNRIVQLIAGNPELCDMRIQNVHWDEADGGGGGMSAVFTQSHFGEAIVVFRGTAAGEWRDDFLGSYRRNGWGIYNTAEKCLGVVWIFRTDGTFLPNYGYGTFERWK